MRDSKRIQPFMQEMGDWWKSSFPDWRFGQVMVNFMRTYGDPFYLEEDEFMEKFREFCQENSMH